MDSILEATNNIDHTESYKYFDQAISIAKNEIQKDFAKAKSSFEEQLYPNLPDNLQKLYTEQYNNDLSEISKTNALVAYQIGSIYLKMERNSEAKFWLEKAKTMFPDDERLINTCDDLLLRIPSK
jgi:tetratricopeptide (TPR) repeat protein